MIETEEEFEEAVLLDSLEEIRERVRAYMGLRDEPDRPTYSAPVTNQKLDVSPFPEPGMQVEIEYTDTFFTDEGYFFQLPGLSGDPHNTTVLHIPEPGPLTKGGPVPVWTHLMDALAMKYVSEIRA